MMVTRTVAPAIEPVSLAEARLHLRVVATDEDDLISALIIAAREWAEGYQNRAYITQTWQLWLDEFPGEDYIRLPFPPLQATGLSVKYYGTTGTEATMTASDYIVDAVSQPGRIVLAYGKSWPSTTLRPAKGVCVTFVAGYGDGASNVPQRVKHAMLLAIGTWYEQRETITVGPQANMAPFAAEMLLNLDRMVPV